MDIDKIKAFCMVAEFENLAKAAENLSVSPSWISKQISSLEDYVRRPLFFRSKKKFILSEEGKIFLQSAQKILMELKKAENLLESHKEEISGNITISTTNALAALYMIDAIADFSKKYKDVNLTIVGSDEENHLVFGKVDVVMRPLVEHHEDFERMPLMQYQMHLYASQEYINTYGTINEVKDLKKHRIISYGHYSAFPYDLVNWHLSLLPENFKPCISINSGVALLKAVEAGLGIASLSQIGQRDSKVPLVKVLPDHPGPVIENYFYYPTSMKGSKKIKALYEHLFSFFSNQK